MSGIGETCSDDRFELIAKAKAELLDATNIESNPTDMAALDSILFRCWQMGWLDHLRMGERETINKTGDFVTHDTGAKEVDA